MRTGNTSATFLLCLLLFFAAIPAHGMPQDSQSRAAVTPDVTIIIEKEKVLLTARQAVEYLQLQILDAAGEVVFDSGPVQGNEIAWLFQNGAGEAVKSGLYAYRLTVKEAGKESAQTRRGHFIVDRAKDRDGGADKLWVTSQNDGGIGADLTVARGEDGAIAGAVTPVREKGKERADAHREGKDEATQSKKTDRQALNVAGIGTPGQIARFVSEEEVGNSSITELNGNVGMGETNPALLSGGSGRLLSISDQLNPGVALTNTGAGGNQFFLYSFAGGSVGSGSFRIYDATNGADRFVLNHYGSVGIGTANPRKNLHVHSNGSTSPIVLSTGSGSEGPASFLLQADSGLFGQGKSFVIYDEVASKYRMVINGNGQVGLGTPTPFGELHIAGYGPFITLESRQNGINKMAHVQNADGNLVFKPFGFGSCCAAMVMQADTGNVGIGTSAPQAKLDVGGQTRTQSLQITGGADFAENFDVNVETTGDEELAAKVEVGMVVSIDPTSPGKLRLSAQAYDRRVAGIISGAGGVKPGMMMSQEGTLADGKHPVALSGRVYVWADASQGAIEPGDLLTTSATPGHAMKVADATKAQGAIIGKAMTGLKDGKGLVLALVTLQ
jgi:hypothetical protein